MKFKDSRPNRQGVADQFRTLIRCARELAEGVEPATFTRPPADGGWSAAQCIEHVNATARLYLPELADAIQEARVTGLAGSVNDGRTLLGRVVAWSQEPPVRLPVRTYDALLPDAELDPDALLDEFVALHEELIVRYNESGHLDRKRVRMASVLNPRLKLSLGDWFAFLAAHGRRHLWQAERVLDQLAGPE